MVQSLRRSKSFRVLFNSPELVEEQRSGFHHFLKDGIREELSKISLLEVKRQNVDIEVLLDASTFQLIAPDDNSRNCIIKMKTYACKLYVQIRIVWKKKSGDILMQTEPEWVLLAHLPMMTKRGHFIINGSPRVIVHQVVRAPGIYFQKFRKVKKDERNKARFYGDIIPRKGVWVRLQISKTGQVEIKLKKSTKVQAEMVERCLAVIEKQELSKRCTPELDPADGANASRAALSASTLKPFFQNRTELDQNTNRLAARSGQYNVFRKSVDCSCSAVVRRVQASMQAQKIKEEAGTKFRCSAEPTAPAAGTAALVRRTSEQGPKSNHAVSAYAKPKVWQSGPRRRPAVTEVAATGGRHGTFRLAVPADGAVARSAQWPVGPVHEEGPKQSRQEQVDQIPLAAGSAWVHRAYGLLLACFSPTRSSPLLSEAEHDRADCPPLATTPATGGLVQSAHRSIGPNGPTDTIAESTHALAQSASEPVGLTRAKDECVSRFSQQPFKFNKKFRLRSEFMTITGISKALNNQPTVNDGKCRDGAIHTFQNRTFVVRTWPINAKKDRSETSSADPRNAPDVNIPRIVGDNVANTRGTERGVLPERATPATSSQKSIGTTAASVYAKPNGFAIGAVALVRRTQSRKARFREQGVDSVERVTNRFVLTEGEQSPTGLLTLRAQSPYGPAAGADALALRASERPTGEYALTGASQTTALRTIPHWPYGPNCALRNSVRKSSKRVSRIYRADWSPARAGPNQGRTTPLLRRAGKDLSERFVRSVLKGDDRAFTNVYDNLYRVPEMKELEDKMYPKGSYIPIDTEFKRDFSYKHIFATFKAPWRYSLGEVGRHKLNKKFGLDLTETQLTSLDVQAARNWLYRLRDGKEIIDDIDHSQNRRVRQSGELIQNQFENGVTRLRKLVRRKLRTPTFESLPFNKPLVEAYSSSKPVITLGRRNTTSFGTNPSDDREFPFALQKVNVFITEGEQEVEFKKSNLESEPHEGAPRSDNTSSLSCPSTRFALKTTGFVKITRAVRLTPFSNTEIKRASREQIGSPGTLGNSLDRAGCSPLASTPNRRFGTGRDASKMGGSSSWKWLRQADKPKGLKSTRSSSLFSRANLWKMLENLCFYTLDKPQQKPQWQLRINSKRTPFQSFIPRLLLTDRGGLLNKTWPRNLSDLQSNPLGGDDFSPKVTARMLTEGEHALAPAASKSAQNQRFSTHDPAADAVAQSANRPVGLYSPSVSTNRLLPKKSGLETAQSGDRAGGRFAQATPTALEQSILFRKNQLVSKKPNQFSVLCAIEPSLNKSAPAAGAALFEPLLAKPIRFRMVLRNNILLETALLTGNKKQNKSDDFVVTCSPKVTAHSSERPVLTRTKRDRAGCSLLASTPNRRFGTGRYEPVKVIDRVGGLTRPSLLSEAEQECDLDFTPKGKPTRFAKSISLKRNLGSVNRTYKQASELFSTKPINGALREFFGSNPLSQYMDQTNPLAELTHKRRISSLGIGGVSRESAGMAIRGIHPTHYGRICPIETPEGKNAGLVNSLALYARINKHGFIETPYYKVVKGQVQEELGFSFYSALKETVNRLHLAPSDLQQSQSNMLGVLQPTALLTEKKQDRPAQEPVKNEVLRTLQRFTGTRALALRASEPYGRVRDNYAGAQLIEGKSELSSAFVQADSGSLVPVRVADTLLDVFKKVSPYQVDCIGISPVQILSVATSLIPFLEHNDANRALMGSNMQRQAVPLMISERPIVGTGLETLIAAESGQLIQSSISGLVSHVSANKIIIERRFNTAAKTGRRHRPPARAKSKVCTYAPSAGKQRTRSKLARASCAKGKLVFAEKPKKLYYLTMLQRNESFLNLEWTTPQIWLDSIIAASPNQPFRAHSMLPDRARSISQSLDLPPAPYSARLKRDDSGRLTALPEKKSAEPVAGASACSPSVSKALRAQWHKMPTAAPAAGPYAKPSVWRARQRRAVGAMSKAEQVTKLVRSSVTGRRCGPTISKLLQGRARLRRAAELRSGNKKAWSPTQSVKPLQQITLLPFVHSLRSFSRSNQETCLTQKPLVQEGEWIQKGDILTDCSASEKGELAVGKNVLIAYLPWEGYNFEDAIVVSDRLTKEQIYASLHIERYVCEAQDIKEKITNSNEWFTRNLPGVNPRLVSHLDTFGFPKIGTILKEGDILVGKMRYFRNKPTTPYEKLLSDILGDGHFSVSLTSLRVPKGVHEARVISHRVVKTFRSSLETTFTGISRPAGTPKMVHIFLGEKRSIQIGDKMSGRHGNKGIISTILPKQDMPYLPDGAPIDILLNPLGVPSRMNVGQIFESLLGLASTYLNQNFKITAFDELYGVEASQSLVYLKLYQARLQSGQNWLFQINFPGKTRLIDGRSGDCFDQWVTVGRAYMLKLIHMVNEKIHARNTGPYALITQQPLRGRSQKGGQRLGEMEVWALEGYGAAYILQELLTKKSDDFAGRQEIINSLVVRSDKFSSPDNPYRDYSNPDDPYGRFSDPDNPYQVIQETRLVLGHPEIFKTLICELQALCLDVGVYALKKESFQREYLGIVN